MRTDCRVSPGAYLLAAMLLLLLPLSWLAAAFFAGCFHELCHYAALRLCGCRPRFLSVGCNGAAMQIKELTYGKELACALAGPAGSLLLLLLSRWLPRLALCGAFHGLYNLLPLYPMDGGRVLRCGARLLLHPLLADKVCIFTERACLVAICLAALYGAAYLHLGLLPIGFAVLLVLKREKTKIPCKETQLAVQ